MKYDVIVVGGGHAGIEACYSTSQIGHKTLLITGNIKNIGDMPCNPSIGGSSKGVIVREIDALGGLMGKIADQSLLQLKMLNTSKGPAVRCLRAQADKEKYPFNMQETLKKQKNLDIKEAIVENLIINNNTVEGIVLSDGTKIYSKIVILTTGTYLKSVILRGDKKKNEGPHGEKRSNELSNNLKKLGFNILRLKTGTPPRIDADSVDYTKMKEELGDKEHLSFSFDTKSTYDETKQEKCYLIYTNSKTHKIITDNLQFSSMYGGYVEGIGPRYCPSIEDKIVKFKDKERHILFLEPQSMEPNSKYYKALYLQGFSTSMPIEVQEKMVHSLEGLENAKILEYAYAIEYDAIDPIQVKPSLESKIINNLFTAGQINGTSGYEEAAGQGIMAGINASKKLKNEDALVLKRSEAYIGVLIDDLVTKGTIEPYRMLTSRAEYRLLLRHDNADLRLRKYGYDAGLISKQQYNRLIKKQNNIQSLIDTFKSTKVSKSTMTEKFGILSGYNIFNLIKRPDIEETTILELINNLTEFQNYEKEEIEQAFIEIKYEGYIKKAIEETQKLIKLESKKIPTDIDYNKIQNLASEARQKLNLVRPETIAQAQRISGVNPSDVSILTIYLKKEYGKNE